MAKQKPKRHDPIEITIDKLEKIQKEVMENKTEILLVNINEIFELSLSRDLDMHNRISYSKTKLLELAENIETIAKDNSGLLGTGLLNPVMLRRKEGRLERIHGENRIKALKLNNKKQVPAVILDNVSDELARFMRTSENLNREDLNAYDETLSILEHIQIACRFESIEKVKSFINKIKNFQSGKTSLDENEEALYAEVSAIFTRVGRFDIITFCDRLSVLNLNELLKQALVDEVINYSQARVINTKLKTDEEIKKILKVLLVKSLSIKELRDYISNLSISNKEDVVNNKIDTVKRIGKTITLAKYNKLNFDDRKFIDNKFDEIEKILLQINSKIN